MSNTHFVALHFLHAGVVSMSHVFVGASAFKYAKDLVAWNISKVTTMTQMLGEDNSSVWNTLTSCDKKTLWNAWYDLIRTRGIDEGGERGDLWSG